MENNETNYKEENRNGKKAISEDTMRKLRAAFHNIAQLYSEGELYIALMATKEMYEKEKKAELMKHLQD